MTNIQKHRKKCNFPKGENSTRNKWLEEIVEFLRELGVTNEEVLNSIMYAKTHSKALEEEFCDIIISGQGHFESMGKDLEKCIENKMIKNEKKYLGGRL